MRPRSEPVIAREVLPAALDGLMRRRNSPTVRDPDDLWALGLRELVAYIRGLEGDGEAYSEDFWLKRFSRLRRAYGYTQAIWYIRDRLVWAAKSNGPYAASKDMAPIDNVPAWLNAELTKVLPARVRV